MIELQLTDDLQRCVDRRAGRAGYADPTEFLRELIQRDRQHYEGEVARVQALIDDGLASGIGDRDAFAVFDDIVADRSERHG